MASNVYNPPINLIDPVMIVELHQLLTEIQQEKHLAVVLFDSADPDFFLAHYDIAANAYNGSNKALTLAAQEFSPS